MDDGGYYSATLTYLRALKAVGSTDSDKVMAELKKHQDQRHVASGGYIRADGVMVHDSVRDAGEDAAGVQVSVGLLQRCCALMKGEEAFARSPGCARWRRSNTVRAFVTEISGIPVAVILGQLMLGW